MKEAEEGHIASHSDREHKSAKVLIIHGNSRRKNKFLLAVGSVVGFLLFSHYDTYIGWPYGADDSMASPDCGAHHAV